MDLEQLDILEEKINQAVRVIEKVKLENRELLRANQELRSEVDEKERVLQQLKEENENLTQQNESSMGKEKEEIIKSKVEQMLSRLDDLQYNL